MSCRNAEGVWLSTVTPSRPSSSRKASGARLTPYGTTTSRPPWRSAPQISHTEKSNAKEWKSVQTSSSPKPKPGAVAVGDDHPLGPAGGARGVDDVQGVIQAGAAGHRAGWVAGDGLGVGVQEHLADAGHQGPGQLGAGDDHGS